MKKKIIFFILLTAIGWTSSLYSMSAGYINMHSYDKFLKKGWNVETYIAGRGDTLYGIENFVTGDTETNKQEWIFAVKELNDIERSDLKVGQELKILVPGGE